MTQILGYARVSTQDQDLAAQMESLREAGAARIFNEKISGVKRDRPALADLMKNLQAGDTLLVTRLDRLARSTYDLLSILNQVTEKGATFKSMADGWADTATPFGKLAITILGSIAEFERSLILARTSQGRARAKAAGRSIGGPKRRMSDSQIAVARQRMSAGQHPADIAQDYGVSANTIKRLKIAAAPRVSS